MGGAGVERVAGKEVKLVSPVVAFVGSVVVESGVHKVVVDHVAGPVSSEEVRGMCVHDVRGVLVSNVVVRRVEFVDGGVVVGAVNVVVDETGTEEGGEDDGVSGV